LGDLLVCDFLDYGLKVKGTSQQISHSPQLKISLLQVARNTAQH
jgi:hypothetical protein